MQKVGHSSMIQIQAVKPFGFFTHKGCFKKINLLEAGVSAPRVYKPLGKLYLCGYFKVFCSDFNEDAEINTTFVDINAKHTIFLLFCVPLAAVIFLVSLTQ